MCEAMQCEGCARLRSCPLQRLSEGGRRDLAASLHAWRVNRDHIIYAQDSLADDLYMLCAGSVKLVRASAMAQRIVGIVKPGEWFGTEALAPSRQRSFMAVAREDSIIRCVECRQLSAIAQRDQVFLWQLTEFLSMALEDAQRTYVMFSGQPVRERVLNAVGHCNARAIALKNIELAELLGASAETISRATRKRTK